MKHGMLEGYPAQSGKEGFGALGKKEEPGNLHASRLVDYTSDQRGADTVAPTPRDHEDARQPR